MQVYPPATEPTREKAPAVAASEVEEPLQPEEANERQSDASHEPDQPEDIFQVTEPAAAPLAKADARKVQATATKAAKKSPEPNAQKAAASPVTPPQLLSMTRFSSSSLPARPRHVIAAAEPEPAQVKPEPAPVKAEPAPVKAEPAQLKAKPAPLKAEPAPVKAGTVQVKREASPASAVQQPALLPASAPVAPRPVEPPAATKEHHENAAHPTVHMVQKPAETKPSLFPQAAAKASTSREAVVDTKPRTPAAPEHENATKGPSVAARLTEPAPPGPVRQLAAIKPFALLAPAKPPAAEADKLAAAPLPQPEPAFGPHLKGELELEVSGKEIAANGIKVQILFRDYPKNRHQKPMTKAQSKRVKTLFPKSSRTGMNTVQSVIEAAPDGIYEFRGAPDNAATQEVSCTVTIHGTSTRPTVKRLGTRKVGPDSYIMKVLMPEGIVWEDDASFSGSIEDSDGVTKYNSETGLVWREYN